jgi:hypothetical protein
MSITPERLHFMIADFAAWSERGSGERKLIRSEAIGLRDALRDYERLRGDREPPHCPSCTCGEHILGKEPI